MLGTVQEASAKAQVQCKGFPQGISVTLTVPVSPCTYMHSYSRSDALAIHVHLHVHTCTCTCMYNSAIEWQPIYMYMYMSKKYRRSENYLTCKFIA